MRRYSVRLLTMLCVMLCVGGFNGCNKSAKNQTSEEVVVQSQTVQVQTTEQSSESNNEVQLINVNR